jgi:hypothetical protein
MPEYKEDKKIFLTPAGAMVALICFFLPWVKVSCGRIVRTFSGPDIGEIFWFVLIAALVIIVTFFYSRSKKQLEKSKYVVIFSSIVALAAIFIKYISLVCGQKNVLVKAGTKAIQFEIHVGAMGTIIGFIVVIIGSFFVKTGVQKEQDKPES